MINDARPAWARLFPQSNAASLWFTAGIACGIGLLTIVLAVYDLTDYGIALFCGVPILMGLAAPLLHGIGGRRSFLQLLVAGVMAQSFLFLGLLVFHIEGIFCIIMAAPLWLTIATLGTVIAYPLHRAMWRHYPEFSRGFPIAGLLLLAMVPGWMGAEHVEKRESPLFVVSTTVDIDAPREVVWTHVLSFPDLPAPGWDQGGWLFKAGIARPIRAEITGTGLSATRYCVFSTGRAVEPVRVWEPGRLLEVDVIATPPSMEETSIYPNLHTSHLEGYLESVRARFELIPLPGNRTRVVGTSWYRNRMFPVAYWQIWSDAAIQAVQINVLNHVKKLSEADVHAVQESTFGQLPGGVE